MDPELSTRRELFPPPGLFLLQLLDELQSAECASAAASIDSNSTGLHRGCELSSKNITNAPITALLVHPLHEDGVGTHRSFVSVRSGEVVKGPRGDIQYSLATPRSEV